MAVHLPFSKEARRRLPVLMYNGKLAEREFGKDLKNKKKVIERYKEHNEEVVKNIPKEKLLLFNPAEGWEPLCNFLNVPVPSIQFPKSNTREDFLKNVNTIGSGKFINGE